MITLSGCAQSPDSVACPASLAESPVGVTFNDFADGSTVTVEVCAQQTCQRSAAVGTDPSTWVDLHLTRLSTSLHPVKGAKAISVTVRDLSNKVVAQADSVAVHSTVVELAQCREVNFWAALAISPGRVRASS
ncbi:hypothetical protein G9U51_02995 [Calidifontibacter sp. DB0510]|uniref:Uncharacterized protein n=1 Tax=Metallococcus carri TaxID=1656884 RepID=A0A967AXD7_9MICO|nr:hypothetical protein [Metallococcus carri]NHN54749.1 hypothetical protein [Metallococcus carri]NOP37094.1 hypothetical protein [Calidifontibacter sp. DB2511S]